MPRKRSAETEASQPATKRRSARQAGRNAGPPAVEAEAELPKQTSRKGKMTQTAVTQSPSVPSNAPRRVAKSKSTAERGGKSAAKSKAPKTTGKSTSSDTETTRRSRDVSEDPDVNSLPTRNPEVERHDGEWHWLMKAEPESRFENGIDVKFSIDDLRARDVPEPWDGKWPRCCPGSNLCPRLTNVYKAFVRMRVGF